MYLTGFADEASTAIEEQIRATKELGWANIEARNIGDANIHDISDREFDRVAGLLDDEGIHINCFGSAIANWGQKITDSFDKSLEQTARAIPRMQRLGTKLVRIMSFAILKEREAEDQMEEERFRRVAQIVSLFRDAGIQPVHENCMNYGGMGHAYTLRLLEHVPELKLVFDTGNPVFTDDPTRPKPYPKQSAWQFYQHVKDHIAYVHIKDGCWDYTAEDGGMCFSFAGEGQGDVRAIVKDLLDSGYDGGISMEPHIAAVFHDPSANSDDERRYRAYVEYGKRFMDLVRDIGHGDKLA